MRAIAPDAVHAMSNFTVEHKERSHLFTEGLRTGKATTLSGIIEKDIIEQRIRQLYEYEFKLENWDISHIEEQKICSIENMKNLIQEASLFIEKIFIGLSCFPSS